MAVDGALPRTAGAGPSPAGRRTGGLKRSVASDRYGIPAGHRLPGNEPVRIAAPDARLQAAIRSEDRTCRLDFGYDSTVTRHADRTSPPHTTPAAPSHVPRHSLKGMTAVLLAAARWGRWDAERSDLSMFAPTG